MPFVSDADLESALDDAGASDASTQAALDAYANPPINGLESALAILAALCLGALFFTQRVPSTQPGGEAT